MKKAPKLWKLIELVRHYQTGAKVCIWHQWYPSRQSGYVSFRERLRIAWKVFRGEADAVEWPGNQ